MISMRVVLVAALLLAAPRVAPAAPGDVPAPGRSPRFFWPEHSPSGMNSQALPLSNHSDGWRTRRIPSKTEEV